MLSTHFDSYLQFAFWTGIGALVLAVLAGLLLVHLRFALIRRTRREQAFQAEWRPILVSALVSKPPSPPPFLRAGDRVFFLGLWLQLLESVRGPESAGLLDLAYRIGGDTFARDLLKRGNPAEQLLAILALGQLRDRHAWNLLIRVVHGPDTLRSFGALRALVQIDAEGAARELMPLLLGRDDWPISRVAALLQANQGAFAPRLLDIAGRIEGPPLTRALRFVEALRLHLPTARLSRLLGNDQPVDVIISALRITLAPALMPEVRALLAHTDWRVRVHVGKVLGRLGESQDIAHLKTLLVDREWWVRYCAACSLIGLPFVDRRQVERLRDSIGDPFARDMLLHVLAEKAG